jgi:hypothetical protein
MIPCGIPGFHLESMGEGKVHIPAMDKLDAKLDSQTKIGFHPAIIATMKLARNKLNR